MGYSIKTKQQEKKDREYKARHETKGKIKKKKKMEGNRKTLTTVFSKPGP